MSLREDLEEIMRDGVVAFLPAEQIVTMKTDTSERIINKVLDAAVEAVVTVPQFPVMYLPSYTTDVIIAINKLREEKE